MMPAMPRLCLAALILVGCSSQTKPPPAAKSDLGLHAPDGGTLSSKIDIGDRSTLWQRLEGIYAIQDNAWAWTAPKFSVVLAARQPVLKVRLFLAPPQVDQLKEITLRARIGGVELPPETYRTPGQHTYVRPIDPKLLQGGPVRVDFIVDDVFRPKPPDTRKLGIVVNSIAIEEQ